MASQKERFLDYSLYLLIIVAIIIGIADYFRDSLGSWYIQNWGYVTGGVGACFALWFGSVFLISWFEVDVDSKRSHSLKKSVLLKQVIMEKEEELAKLSLTEEERDYQIEEWVNEKEKAELRRKYLGESVNTQTTLSQTKHEDRGSHYHKEKKK